MDVIWESTSRGQLDRVRFAGNVYFPFSIGHSHPSDSGPPLPLARVLPSGANASDSSRFFGPVRVRFSSPDCASHSLMVVSLQPLATVLLSGENVTESTSALCPSARASSS